MPKPPYKIDVDLLVKALGDKIVQCPLCQKSHSFNAAPTLMELREFHGGDFVVGTPIVPLAVLTCSHCGNVILLNALSAGLLENPAVENTPKENENDEQ